MTWRYTNNFPFSLLIKLLTFFCLLQKSRIPKRVLHFDDDDEPTTTNARVNTNVLKDGSSRANIATDEAKAVSSSSQSPKEKNQEETLLQKKKQIEEDIRKMSAELEKVNEQLSQLKCRKVSADGSENQSGQASHFGISEVQDDDSDNSPFAHVPSPMSADPLELLTLDKSKRPENIYKVFRQSCSFLTTPKVSAFRKIDGQRTTALQSLDETPNISRRLQKQLADLFDD